MPSTNFSRWGVGIQSSGWQSVDIPGQRVRKAHLVIQKTIAWNLVTCWTICYKYAAKSSPHIQCLYMDRLDFKFQIRTCSLWNIILWGHTPFFIKQKIDWNLNLRQPIQYKFTIIFSSWVYCRYLKSSLYCQFSPICKVPNTGGLGYLSFIRST